MGLESVVEFMAAERDRIPAPDASYDGLVSEFIVYPSTAPTKIEQPEMGRVLHPGGRLILTDVIVTQPLPAEVKEELEIIGLDYLCEATMDEFRAWMDDAGLINVDVQDMTPTLQAVWEDRQEADRVASHRLGYSYLLDHPQYGLGKSIFYIYARGEKPKISP